MSIAYTWGSTPEERASPFPCDALVPDASVALFRAVDVDAPPSVVFRWLCQLRAAPYSYDWIDNGGRQSPRVLTPGLEQLAVGHSVMGVFTLAEFERDHHLTLLGRSPLEALFGRLAVSYVVRPRGAAAARLVAKLAVRYPRGPLGWLMRAILPLGDLVMMRKQLLTLRGLAEAAATG